MSSMSEQLQLYDEQGRALQGQGASKTVVHGQGLLHGGSHVWIWRIKDGTIEILLQKRAGQKEDVAKST